MKMAGLPEQSEIRMPTAQVSLPQYNTGHILMELTQVFVIFNIKMALYNKYLLYYYHHHTEVQRCRS